MNRAPGTTRRFYTVLEVAAQAPTVKEISAAADGAVEVRLNDGQQRHYRWQG